MQTSWCDERIDELKRQLVEAQQARNAQQQINNDVLKKAWAERDTLRELLREAGLYIRMKERDKQQIGIDYARKARCMPTPYDDLDVAKLRERITAALKEGE